MTKKIKFSLLGITCLSAVLLLSIRLGGMSAGAGLVPYLAFCICSCVVCRRIGKVTNIMVIFASGLLILPVLNLVYPMIFVALPQNMIVYCVAAFVQTSIFFLLFTLINSFVSKKKLFSKSICAVLFALVLIYSLLEGAQTLGTAVTFNDALEHGTMVGWISALVGNPVIDIVTNTAFCLALFVASVWFACED